MNALWPVSFSPTPALVALLGLQIPPWSWVPDMPRELRWPISSHSLPLFRNEAISHWDFTHPAVCYAMVGVPPGQVPKGQIWGWFFRSQRKHRQSAHLEMRPCGPSFLFSIGPGKLGLCPVHFSLNPQRGKLSRNHGTKASI